MVDCYRLFVMLCHLTYGSTEAIQFSKSGFIEEDDGSALAETQQPLGLYLWVARCRCIRCIMRFKRP